MGRHRSDPLENVGLRISQGDILQLVPSQLVDEYGATILAWQKLEDLDPRSPKWKDPALRLLQPALIAIRDWLREALAKGTHILVGREDPVAGSLKAFNSGIAWQRAYFDFRNATARTPWRDDPICDVMVVPRQNLPSHEAERGRPSEKWMMSEALDAMRDDGSLDGSIEDAVLAKRVARRCKRTIGKDKGWSMKTVKTAIAVWRKSKK